MGLKKPAHLRVNRLHFRSKKRGYTRSPSLTIPVEENDNNDDYPFNTVIFTLQIRRNKTDENSTIQQLPLRTDIPLSEVKAKIANTFGIPLRELRVYADKHRLLLNNDATLFELGIDQDTVLLVRRKDDINDSEVAKVVMGFAPESYPTKREISTQYKDLSRIYHPDKCDAEVQEERAEQFKVIGRAKEFMMEQALRKESMKERPLTFHHRGTQRTIRVKSGTSISGVKEEMSKLVGVDASEQMVLHNGRVLDGNKILSEINIEEDDCLQLSAVQPVHLFVKMDGRTITLLVDSTTSIAVVKNEVAIKTGIAPGDQNLSFGAKHIWQDEFTVVDYNLQDGSTIHLLGCVRGGSNGEDRRDADEFYTPPHDTQVVSASSELSSDFSSSSSLPCSNDTSQQHNVEPPPAAVAREHESSKRTLHVEEDEESSDQKRRKTTSLPAGNANALVVVAPSAEIDLSKVTYKNYDLNPAYFEESVYSYLSRGHYQGYVPSNQLIAQPSSSNNHPTPSISRSPTAGLECAFSVSSVTSLAQVPTPDNDATMLSLVPLSGWYGSASIEEVIAEFDACGCTFQPNAIYVPSLRPTVHSCCNEDSSSAHDSSSSAASPHGQQVPSPSATRSPDRYNGKKMKVTLRINNVLDDDVLYAHVPTSSSTTLLPNTNCLVKVKVQVGDQSVEDDLHALIPSDTLSTRRKSELSPNITLLPGVTTGLGSKEISSDEFKGLTGLSSGVKHGISITEQHSSDHKMLNIVKKHCRLALDSHNAMVTSGYKTPPRRDVTLEYVNTMGSMINEAGFVSNFGELATEYSRVLAWLHYATMADVDYKHPDQPDLIHCKMDRSGLCPGFIAMCLAGTALYHTKNEYVKGKDRREITMNDIICICLEKGDEASLKRQCEEFLKKMGLFEHFNRHRVSVLDAMMVLMFPVYAFNLDQILFNNNGENPVPVLAVGSASRERFLNGCTDSTALFHGHGSMLHPQALTDGKMQFREQDLVNSDACITAWLRHVLQSDLEEVGLTVDQLQCYIGWNLKLGGLSAEEIQLLEDSLLCRILPKIAQAVKDEMPNFPNMSKADIAEALKLDASKLKKYGLEPRWVKSYVLICRAHEKRALHLVAKAVNAEKPNCPDMSRVKIAESFGEEKLKEYDLTQEMVQEYVKHMDMHQVSYAVNREMPSATDMSKADIAESFDAAMRAKYNLTKEMVQKYVKFCESCEERVIQQVGQAVNKEEPNYPNMSKAAIAEAFTTEMRAKYNLTEEMVQEYVKFCKACEERALRPVINTVKEVKDALGAASTKADKLDRLCDLFSDLREQITSFQFGGRRILASFELPNSSFVNWQDRGAPKSSNQNIIVKPDSVKEPVRAALKALLAGMETDPIYSALNWKDIADVMYLIFDGENLTAMEVKDALGAASTKADKLDRLCDLFSDLREQITSFQFGGDTGTKYSFQLPSSSSAHWQDRGAPKSNQNLNVKPENVKEQVRAATKALLAGMETDSIYSALNWKDIADVTYLLLDGRDLTAMEVKDALEASSALDGKRAQLRGLPKIASIRKQISFKFVGKFQAGSLQIRKSQITHWQGRGAPKSNQFTIVEPDSAKESVRVALRALLKGMEMDPTFGEMRWDAIKNELSRIFGA